jgi:hypothetical protein
MSPETPPASSRLHPAVWVVTALTAAVHLAVAGRYDIFRNELYFIVCGWHPDFGYADQPPLVPLIAAATQIFGINAWLLRLPAVIAAVALVPLTALFARRLGGNTSSEIIAAIAAAIAPALIGLTSILTTTTFEPIAWTACAYCIALAVLTDNRKALIWAGGIVGLSLEAKYGIAPWLTGLAIGLLATPARRLFAWRETWIGAAIAVAIAAPSLIWQAAHGWPFAALIAHHGTSHAIFTGSPLHYEIVQVFALNVVLALLWIAGIIAPFAVERLKPMRFLAIAFVIATVITIAAGGKDYYMFAAYPAMFAVGAAAFRGIRAWLASLWLVLAFAQSVILAPVVLPLLSPPRLARLFAHSHLRPPPDEAAAIGAPLTQVFSDELGWRALEHQVAAVWRALPANERGKAAILATNYGEAAAIDVYGKADGLPPALSGQNQYYIWGTHGFDGSVIIHVNGDPERWRDGCASVETVAKFGAPYVMPYENNAPIFICRGLKRPLAEIWPRLKRYQ